MAALQAVYGIFSFLLQGLLKDRRRRTSFRSMHRDPSRPGYTRRGIYTAQGWRCSAWPRVPVAEGGPRTSWGSCSRPVPQGEATPSGSAFARTTGRSESPVCLRLIPRNPGAVTCWVLTKTPPPTSSPGRPHPSRRGPASPTVPATEAAVQFATCPWPPPHAPPPAQGQATSTHRIPGPGTLRPGLEKGDLFTELSSRERLCRLLRDGQRQRVGVAEPHAGATLGWRPREGGRVLPPPHASSSHRPPAAAPREPQGPPPRCALFLPP